MSKTILLLLGIGLTAAAQTLPPQPSERHDIAPEIRPQDRPDSPAKGSHAPGPNLSSETLLQNPQLLHHALYSSVVLHNVEGTKVLLPLYRRLPPPHDNTLIDMAEALLAQAEGRHADAAARYRSVLAQEPNLPPVRLALAQALLADRQNEAAEDQFTRLKTQNGLPQEIHEEIDHFLDILRQRRSWQFQAGLQYLRDGNLNNAPNGSVPHGRGSITQKRETGEGFGYQLAARRDWQIGRNLFLRTALDADGRHYWDNRPYNETTVRLLAGGVYQNARSEAAILPFAERRWSGGQAYSLETGLRLEAKHWFTPAHQLLLAAETGRLTHDPCPRPLPGGRQTDPCSRRNGSNHSASATWLYIQNPQQYWVFGTQFQRRTVASAHDRDDAYRRYSMRLGWTREWRGGLSTALTANLARSRYDAPGFLYPDKIRRQTEINVLASLWHRNFHFWGITPRLTVSWSRRNSNLPLFEFQKTNAFVQLNRTF